MTEGHEANATAPASSRLARSAVIASAWAELGDGVAPLSNGAGRPLARTIKLVLDPLVIRPVQSPHLASATLTVADADELRARILAAGPDLTATSAWFVVLKRCRRRLGITAGNPQDRYFQRCFELAREHGAPEGGGSSGAAESVARETLAELHDLDDDAPLEQLRRLLRDSEAVAAFERALAQAWSTAAATNGQPEAALVTDDVTNDVTAALDECIAVRARGSDVARATPVLDALADARVGSASAAELAKSGVAASLGFTDHELPPRPQLGDQASKRDLPRPFDRSIYQRLFAVLATGAGGVDDVHDLVHAEIGRAASPWQLAHERSHVTMLLGREASLGLERAARAHDRGTTLRDVAGADGSESADRGAPEARMTQAHRMLRDRWRREAFVRRATRLPADESGLSESVQREVRDVRQAYLRRLWVRLHGREVRNDTAEVDVWDTLDGALRSVILDQRHRVKRELGREPAHLDASDAESGSWPTAGEGAVA